MYIGKLEIKGFGKLRDLTVDLDRGFNLIYGDNESGKTSIQWFIKSILFGLKGGRTGRDGSLPPAKRFSPWTGGDYSGCIGYCLDNGEEYRALRNFENNSVKVYDPLFNEITTSFEMTRDRGALFSEKQLGINEACFERTVFIKQMESRVDDDGSRELLSRLMNITETGYEDVSFKKAQEALRNALKTYVGTDKTYTRPLDRLNERLQELMSLKEGLVHNRESLLSVDREMNNAMQARKHLTVRKDALERIKELIKTGLEIERKRKLEAQIGETLESITNREEELARVKNSILGFGRIKEELGRFSSYGEDDAEAIGIQYGKLLNLQQEYKRLEEETADKQERLNVLEMELEPLKAFIHLDENIQDEVLKLNRELEFFKKEQGKADLEAVSTKTERVQRKHSQLKYTMLASAVISALMPLIAFLNRQNDVVVYSGIAAAFAGIAATLMIALAVGKAGREVSLLTRERELGLASLKNIQEEIGKRQKTIADIYSSVGAGCIEEFLTLKAQFDGKTQHITLVNTEMDMLETKLKMCLNEKEMLEGLIRSKLTKTGILGDCTQEITSQDIQEFKNGIRRYLGLDPSMDYSKKRVEELDRDLKSRYGYASSICGVDCFSREDLERAFTDIVQQLELSENNLNEMAGSIKRQYVNNGISEAEFLQLEKKLPGPDLGPLKMEYDYEYDKTAEELNNTIMKVKECEILSGNLSNNSYDLQRVEEEIYELKARKGHLEDINISLKLALDVLTEASAELQKDFVPALNSRMSGIMKRITGGRYTDLRADNNLSLKVVSPETGDVTGVFSLSGGTVDQMYLAMRIAMADLITGTDEILPLFLDEILAQYDDTRTRDTLEFLYELSQQRQIVLFTCKSREVELARSVCGEGLNVINL